MTSDGLMLAAQGRGGEGRGGGTRPSI